MKRSFPRYAFLAAALSIFAGIVVIADNTAQLLPFSQDWTNTGLITTTDDWSGVPGVIGYRGDGLTAATGVDPQTVVADGTATPVDVNANQTSPNTFGTGGIAEFHITDPVVALQGSGTADAPFLLFHLNTTGLQSITVSYNLRDVDGAADNAVQPVALQFRVGSTGDFTNVPAGFVADASTGPSLATLVTPVSAVLPAAADNQPLVQVRVITTDAAGSDEWIGVDDVQVTGTPVGGSTDPTGVGAANPSLVDAGDSTLLTVTVTPGTNPTSTGLAVTADLTAIGGSGMQPFFDDATNGDVTAGDNVFSFGTFVPLGTLPGTRSLPASITDAQARSGSATILLTVRSDLVVSQVYGGGGNTGATLKNDFIELFNRGTSTISVAGWSVQYASASGTSWQTTALTGSIPPGRYYLVGEGAGAGGTVDLPPPDASGSITMAAPAGKVALVNSTTPLTGTGCPIALGVMDFVGYGSANCSETSPTAAPSNTFAVLRVLNGCTDTANNSADFSTGTPNPRNSATPAFSCVPMELAIPQIQGSGTSSPFAGQLVQTTGIVTGVRFNNGFFIQDPAGDADPSTSEGIFVFTSSPPPPAAAPGNLVRVTGIAFEFVPSADPFSPPVSEIVGPLTVDVLSTGNPLPAAIEITAADTSPSGSIEQLEKYEGMRVSVSSLTVVGPTQGSVTENSATSTSNGVFYGVITGIARPFREPGIQVPDPLPAGSPCCVPRFDLNPERLRVDSNGQVGATTLEVATGANVTGLIGPLDYGFRTYTILPDPASPPAAVGGMTVTPVPARAADEFTVGSFNLERFFNDLNDAPNISGEPQLTSTAFANRLNKASLAIRDVLRSPDILGVIEIENLATLQSLAARLNADDPTLNYVGYLEEGNDIGGIDVGFLVRSNRVGVVDVTQEGKTATFIDPSDSSLDLLNDRPPLVLRANITPAAGFPVTVIVNHLRSLNDVEDLGAAGERVREKRRKQAEFLANLIQTHETAGEHVISVGDYNAFQFNDGYVDSIGTIKGTPTPADQVVLASSDLVNPDLTDLVDGAPASQRYSYVFDGNAQVLDHILISGNLTPRFLSLAHARLDADFPDSYRNDPNRPERISDHDAPVAYFSAAPRLFALSPARVWIGLANSDDVGIRFDLRGEVYLNGTQLVGSGELASAIGGSSGFNNAKLDSIPLTLTAPVNLGPGDTLSLRLLVRNACSGSGKNSGRARLWFNDAAANSRFDATIDATADYYLRDAFTLTTTAGPGPKKTIDVQSGAKCSVYKSFGTWTTTLN